MTPAKPNTIQAYIEGFPEDIQLILTQVYQTIKKAAPDAEERISYAMPTFTLNGNLIHFAAFKNHIGLYPTPNGIEAFREELSKYKGAKGSIQLPLNQTMPLDLIARIVKHRVEVNLRK